MSVKAHYDKKRIKKKRTKRKSVINIGIYKHFPVANIISVVYKNVNIKFIINRSNYRSIYQTLKTNTSQSILPNKGYRQFSLVNI